MGKMFNPTTITIDSTPIRDSGNAVSSGGVFEAFGNTWDLANAGANIPNNSDLNDYTTPGNYYVSDASVAATIQNSPISTSGYRVIVVRGYLTGVIHQIIVGTTNRLLYRTCFRSNWTDWEGLVTRVDPTPTQDSGNAVSSGGVFEALKSKATAGDILSGPVIQSSTEGSAKRFRLTVDDSGTVSAVEVTA